MEEDIERLRKVNARLKKELIYYRKSRPEFAKALKELRQKYRELVSNLRIKLDTECRKFKKAQETIESLQKKIQEIKKQKAEDFKRELIKQAMKDDRSLRTGNEVLIYTFIKEAPSEQCYQEKISKTFKINKSTVNNAIRSLIIKNIIEEIRVKGQRDKRKIFYAIKKKK